MTRIAKWGFLIFFGFIGIALLSGRAKPSAEELQSGTRCLPGFDGSYRPLKEAVENNLRDPDSFQLVDTTITPLNAKGFHVVEMTYRARNGFGGMNVEIARAKVAADCSMIEIIPTSD